VGAVGDSAFNIEGFQRWATGNLVDNRNRGIFAEWMVGEALDCIGPDAYRVEWDSFDLLYGDVKVEVKASGYSQTWNPDNPTIPKFTIAGHKWTWVTKEEAPTTLEEGVEIQHRRSGIWIKNDLPNRPADVYVFCLHEALPATNENVTDPDTWTFWVVPTKTLDAVLEGQKTLGLKKLESLALRVSWSAIRMAVDECCDEGTVGVDGYTIEPGADLSGADLSGADLSGADLKEADLSGADLKEARLSGVNLSGADLSGADLSGADLKEAIADAGTVWPDGFDLGSAGVQEIGPGVNLSGASLSQVNLEGANLSGANLSGADLSQATLRNAYLAGAELSGAHFGRANLRGAQMQGVNLSGAQLGGARFYQANLCGANLSSADLSLDLQMFDPELFDEEGLEKAYEILLKEVDLRGASLKGANLRGQNLATAGLTGSTADSNTVWPEGFDPVAAGVIFE
jgi:uncharacterized protein YjbI with pentapeptide repeats